MNVNAPQESLMRKGMSIGTWMALLWTLSFLSSMLGRGTLLGTLSLPLGLFSLYYIARVVAREAIEQKPPLLVRIVALTLWGFFFCALLTTFFQAVYLATIDQGVFANELKKAMELVVNTQGMDPQLKAQMEQIPVMMSNLSTSTQLLLTQNLLMGITFALFTAPGSYFIAKKLKDKA